ncbi:synaptonemal complex protein SC65-like [Sinocyclocheilus anshuiensis]|uniref:Synaptonemal complex protein SC65-like n=1 Tax=Sinocyclocheilus anshuiensis TaxID=1608454 RepID=A0A671LCP1_9TELE|nr:PREDICTED: synaptonemal complex protein SC65-like [Sinocyclocheilus anshuiensis]
MAQRRICLVVFFSSAYLYCTVQAQYEKYSFNSFPANDLMPLESAYGHALEMYAAQDWKQSAKYLELSLRLHRLLKDSEAHCSQNCSAVGREHEENNTETTLLIMGHIIMRAACLKRCKTNFPVFSKSYPKRETLGAFEQRIPYRYLQYVYYQMNELERAVSAAHSYLQRNPEDPLLSRSLNYYKSLFDTEEYLVHHEEKPCEALFLKAVKLYNSGDFSSSARDMELAAAEYFKTFNTCLMSCEGSYDVQEFKDFYPTLADFYFEVMKCKVKCEENLIPNVGGFFVEKFVATMYHYMQFAYYKLNDVRNAALCAASYMLFDANDQVMQQNMAYYRFHRQQWGLQDEHFKPRPEALRYFNQTTKLRELLEFAQNYLQTDDEDTVSSEEAASALSNPPDEEFEGIGDYEESFLAEWWQEPKTKGDTGEPAE